MRLPLLVMVVAALAMAAPAAVAASAPAQAAPPTAPHQVRTFVAFRSHFGFGGSRRRGYGFGPAYPRTSRHPLLRRVVKTAIWLYVLHLFFTHGGLSILLWIVIIAVVLSLLRRRRRRYAYSR